MAKKKTVKTQMSPTVALVVERAVVPLGPWLASLRLPMLVLGGLALALILNPLASTGLFGLLADGSAATGLALPVPSAPGLALLAALVVAVAAVVRAAAPALAWVAVPVGLGALLAFLALQGGFNADLAASPFGLGYDAFWGLPLAAFAPLLLALAVRHHEAADGRGWLVMAFVGVVLFALMPFYRLMTPSLPLVEDLAGLFGDQALAGLFALAFFGLATALFVGGLTRRRGLVLGAGLALAALLPLWLALQAMLQRQAFLGAAAVVSLLGSLLAVDAVVTPWRLADRPVTPATLADHGLVRFGLPAVVLFLFFLMKTHAFLPSTTDENIYFYMAARLAEGKLPYRDFFFAHPPLHLAIPALVFKLTGGFHLAVAKAIPAVAALLAGVLVHVTGRRLGGTFAGLVAMILFLFATETLKASTNLTGISETTMLLVAGASALVFRRWLLSGVLFALAAHTGFYMVAVPVALLAVFAFGDRRGLVRFGGAFLGVYAAIFALCLAVGGENYLQGVFYYHWGKPAKSAMLPYVDGMNPFAPLRALFHNLGLFLDAEMWRRTLYYHAHLFWGSVVAVGAILLAFAREREAASAPKPCAAGGAEGKPAKQGWWHLVRPADLLADRPSAGARLLLYALVVLLVEFSMFKELYEFYFTLMLPFAAWLTGFAVVTAARAAWEAAESKPPALVAPLAIIGLFCLWLPVAAHANRVFPDELSEAGKLKEYTYSEPPVWKPLGPLVKALFWKDYRVKGEMGLGLRHYLWNKKLYVSKADEMAAWVRDHTKEGDTITGGSLIAPLIALLSGRNLAADIADTNSKTFWSDMSLGRDHADLAHDPEARRRAIEAERVHQFFEKVCATPITYVISAQQTYFNEKRIRDLKTMQRHFTLEKTFVEDRNKHWGTEQYGFWRAKSDAVPRCTAED